MNQHKEELKKIDHLLKFAGRFKLLDKSEEHQLIGTFQACYRLIPLFLKAACTSRRIKSKTRQQLFFTAFLLAHMKAQVIRILVNTNLKLIIKYANVYSDKGIDIEDLVSEGADGLIHAAELFEIQRNLKFSTYAVPWIKQRMGRAIENKSKVVKTPPNVQAKMYKLNKIYRKWIEKFGEPPTPEEISDQFWEVHKEALTAGEAEELGRLKHGHTSLDETFGEDDNVSVGTYLSDNPTKRPDARVEVSADKDYVKNMLSLLSEEDAKFIMLRFGVGIADEQPRADKEMSVIFQISTKEVKERERRILKQLESMADRNGVNMDFECDIILESIPTPAAMHMVCHITGLSESQIGAMVKQLPHKLGYRIPQDKAQELVDSLMLAGCKGRIVNYI